VWAKVEPIRGQELFAQEQRAARVTTRFTIRAPARPVVPRWRLIWRGRWFDVEYAREVDGMRFWVEIFAAELVEVPLS
jgi:SPP1 family predicted phage head-tail adaptor